MRYIATSLPPPADAAYWHPAPAPPPSPLFSILSSLVPSHFWLVVLSLLIHRPPSDPGYIFFAFFALFLHRKRWEFIGLSHLSHVLPPSHLLAGVSSSLIPSSQLSFDCCVVLSMVSTEGHSSILPPYFLMRISVVAPKITTTNNGAANSKGGHLIVWTNRKPWRHDLVAPLTCPWRERASPLSAGQFP